MPLPHVTVVLDETGCHHPAGARAWWMGDAGVLIRAATVDTDDASVQVHRALSIAGPGHGGVREHLRDAEAGLRHVREHLEQARRGALH